MAALTSKLGILLSGRWHQQRRDAEAQHWQRDSQLGREPGDVVGELAADARDVRRDQAQYRPEITPVRAGPMTARFHA
jgi:hypothetical protein